MPTLLLFLGEVGDSIHRCSLHSGVAVKVSGGLGMSLGWSPLATVGSKSDPVSCPSTAWMMPDDIALSKVMKVSAFQYMSIKMLCDSYEGAVRDTLHNIEVTRTVPVNLRFGARSRSDVIHGYS